MKKYLYFLLCICLMLICGCNGGETSSVLSGGPEVSSVVTPVTPSDTVSISEESSSEVSTSSEGDTIKQEFDWKTHPEDFKLIAFTFDDAPSYQEPGNNFTTHIIDTLNAYEGAGTLFVTGNSIEKNGIGLLKYAINKNFEIGNHTWHHLHLPQLDETVIKEEIVSLNNYVEQTLGVTMKFCRPGYIDVDTKVYNVCTELGMPIVSGNKNKSLLDYSSDTTVEYIIEATYMNAYDGSIILMHGWSEQTAQAIEEICSTLYAQGYRFVTLSELFEYKGFNISYLPTDRII